MGAPIIEVKGISKKYRIGHRENYLSLRDSLVNIIKKPLNFLKRSSDIGASNDEFWALKDVSFNVEQGEIVGIIGRNGAGKTTMLKILSSITYPTKGEIHIRGRVASLLEVGTGFHPELTGRENIYFNGSILGMKKREIDKKFDEIVAFSEIEKFIDTPAKRYSSGMYLRLAFAVAAHLEPEILLIDEVLAVGDLAFQKKCLGKMGEVAKGGRTVLFVSHNMGAVERLCNRGICLEGGTIKTIGNVSLVLTDYMNSVVKRGEDTKKHIEIRDGEIKFVDWYLDGSDTQISHSCYSREKCSIVLLISAKATAENVNLGFALWDLEGRLILASSSTDNDGSYFTLDSGEYQVIIKTRLPLKAGSYQIDVSLNNAERGQFDRWSAEPLLNVLPRQHTNLPDAWHGILNEDVRIDIQRSP